MNKYLAAFKQLRLPIMLLVSVAANSAIAQEIQARVNGEIVRFGGVKPLMINGRVMVPLRGIFEKMKIEVTWNEALQTVTAKRGNEVIVIPMNSNEAIVNGQHVTMDGQAIMLTGRAMVPLRFVAEALQADVNWNETTKMVDIESADNWDNPANADINRPMMKVDSGSVIPFRFNEQLSSNRSTRGQIFTATIDTDGKLSYAGIPRGTILEGHVEIARPNNGNTPGVLGIAFDRIRFPTGRGARIAGSLFGLDFDSVVEMNGHLVSRPDADVNNLKFVGYGRGIGAMVALPVNGVVLTEDMVLVGVMQKFNDTKKNNGEPGDVMGLVGSRFGVRLTRSLRFRVPVIPSN